MIDRSRMPLRIHPLGAVFALIGGLLLSPPDALAQNIPVRFYISRADDGTGGATIYLTASILLPPPPPPALPSPLTFAVWADPGSAADGQGLFSMQDVLIGETESILFTDGRTVSLERFICTAPSCQVGPRPDPKREVLIAVGDDTSVTPTLTAPFRVGYLTVLGALEGTVSLRAGTALDANAIGAPLEIDALPNQGALIRFVPEPGVSVQILAGAALLGSMSGWRRLRARKPESTPSDAKS